MKTKCGNEHWGQKEGEREGKMTDKEGANERRKMMRTGKKMDGLGEIKCVFLSVFVMLFNRSTMNNNFFLLLINQKYNALPVSVNQL